MIRINLLPSAHRRRKTSNPLPLVIASFSILLILGGGGFFAWQSYSISKLKAEEQSLQQILIDYGKQKVKVDELKSKLAQLQQQLDIKNEIMKDALDVPALIEEISAFTPVDVQLQSLAFSTDLTAANASGQTGYIGSINFSVTTTSYSSAANALVSYEAAPSLANVETAAVSRSEGKVSFSITAALVVQGGGSSDGTDANQ